ncbi:MAG: DNA mismatch repair endonuclease MutL [Tissierellia bacterium]|nr:DNA mismatch repair endonuclease MutL [Tissierellia bacterium]
MKTKISLLSEETIIQIAAGEIIENPSSVIKELVENSIDANSSKISIEIKNNGKDLIKVTDDGYGFDVEDLKIAFKRHTTSKISNIEELKNAISLGFRGEALSSIANVSDVTLITKKAEDQLGKIAKFDHNGNILDLNEIVTNNGTTIICENLFDNIPVRKKYLNLKKYELQKTTDIINRLALSHPDISFEYKKEDKIILKTDRNSSLLNNIYSVLGKEISENLMYIEGKYPEFSIRGYISNNHLFRSNKNYQFLFVNNRSVIDRDLSRIIEKQYQSIIPINRYPVFIIYMDISPSLVDVNIHPKKDIIKFTNIYDLELAFSNIVKEALLPNIKISEYKPTVKEEKINTIFEIYSEKIEEDGQNLGNKTIDNPIISFRDLSTDYVVNIEQDTKVEEHDPIDIVEEEFKNIVINNKNPDFLKNGYRYVGNIFFQYLLLEDNVDKCLYLLDQHAAHERINYEKLVKDYNNKNIPMQNLLSGYIIELTGQEFDDVMTFKDKLLDIGIEIDEFGDNSIIIRSIPAYIESLNPESLIRDILDNPDISTSVYDVNPYELMKMACRMSVKKGVNLSNFDVNTLIANLKECEYPNTCPHGRPTIIKITKDELDKEFFRIQTHG